MSAQVTPLHILTLWRRSGRRLIRQLLGYQDIRQAKIQQGFRAQVFGLASLADPNIRRSKLPWPARTEAFIVKEPWHNRRKIVEGNHKCRASAVHNLNLTPPTFKGIG